LLDDNHLDCRMHVLSLSMPFHRLHHIKISADMHELQIGIFFNA
jgi:hypothetical protein